MAIVLVAGSLIFATSIATAGAQDGTGSVTISDATVSNPLCPNGATVTLSYTATNVPDGYFDVRALLTITTTNPSRTAFYEGYDYEPPMPVDGTVTGSIDVSIPAEAPLGTYEADVVINSRPQPIGSNLFMVVVEGNAGCADAENPLTTVEVLEPVCEGDTSVPFRVTASDDTALSSAEVGLWNPNGGPFLAFNEYEEVTGLEWTKQDTLSVPDGVPAGTWTVRAVVFDRHGGGGEDLIELVVPDPEGCGTVGATPTPTTDPESTATPDVTPTATPDVTPTAAPSATPGVTATPIIVPTATVVPTQPPRATATPAPASTSTPSPVLTPTPGGSIGAMMTPTPTPPVDPGSGGGGLAYTGSDTALVSIIALVLMIVGACGLAIGRSLRS